MTINTQQIILNSNYIHWQDLPDTEIQDLFSKIQKVYQDSLGNGYLVSFGSNPGKGVSISYSGQRQVNEPLPQLDQNNCIFCNQDIDKNETQLNKSQPFYELSSLSNQILVIPKKHYAHWFSSPIDVQILLFKHALELRSNFPLNIKNNIELHCGSSAGQTIPHIHLRTGVYK